jgi:type I restriction enzyme, S subunit
MKSYPAYKKSDYAWIDAIPEHWNVVALKHLVSPRITDGPHESPLFVDDGVPFVSAEAVQNGRINFDSRRGNITREQHEIYAQKCLPQRDDIFLVKSGATTGKLAYVNTDREFGIWSPLALIRAKKDLAYSKYLFQSLGARYFQSQVQTFWSYGTQPNIGMGVLENLRIVLPPLTEQKCIAEFLECKTAQIDSLIEKKQRQIDLLQEQRTALINHAVTKGLDLDALMKDSGVEWLGEIPSHWTMTTVRYFYDVKLGKMLDSNKQNGNELVKPYLRAANIHWNNIRLDEVGVNKMEFTEAQLERYALQSGDLLVTEGGVTVGRSAIWNGELTECYFQNSLNRARPSKHASTKWLYYWMYFVTNNGFIDILADKSTFGHLTNEKLKALPIPIPPQSEHNEIIEKLESYELKMEAQIALIERQIAFLQEYRTALISEAVTGKIDVR